MSRHCKNSLINKVGKITLLFSLIIIVFYTVMMARILYWGLETGAGGILWQESYMFLKAYQEDPNAPLPRGRSVNGYLGKETLPPELADVFSEFFEKGLDHIEEKDRWYKRIEDETMEVHNDMFVWSVPDTDKKLFMYLKLSIPKNDVKFDVWDPMRYTAILGGLLVILLSIAYREVLKSQLKPLADLSQWISRIEESENLEKVPDSISDNEIGQVAQSLFQALERINSSNAREKQFLRNASHELRTPIAIIRSAMDVIEHKQKTGDQKIDHLLSRVRRASDTMKAVTEAILWLAVENYSPPNKNDTDLKSMLVDIIEDNRHLTEGREVKLCSNIDSLENMYVEQALLYIVLDNLVRNAIQHSCGERICVHAPAANTIVIENDRCDTENLSQEVIERNFSVGHFGLGLALVEKISKRMHWDFDFSAEGQFAKATLVLPAKN